MKTFVIVADSRSGGTHLTSALNSLEDVRCVSEPFNHRKLETHEEQTAWALQFYRKGVRDAQAAVGFRTKVKQVADVHAFQTFLDEQETVLIHLRRRNQLKQAISSIRAIELFKATGDYNVKGDAPPLPPSEIKLGALKHHLKAITDLADQENAFIGSFSRLTPLGVFYEDLLETPDEVFARIHEALAIRPTGEIRSVTRKNTPDDLRTAILNYDEVAAFLKGTPFYEFL